MGRKGEAEFFCILLHLLFWVVLVSIIFFFSKFLRCVGVAYLNKECLTT